jgi:hypothetical protein
VDFPTGPVLDFDGFEVLHFELGTLAPAETTEVKVAYGAGNTLAELQAIMDVAVGNLPWLTLTPNQGTIPGGGQLVVNAHFSSAGLLGGVYPGTIQILSNDPDESPLGVPVSMHVIGAPRLVASRDSIAFGTLFAGQSRTDTLTLSNPGTDLLSVTSVTVSPAAFTADVTPFTLAPGAHRTLVVGYAPSAVGVSTGALTFASNDPSHPSLAVVLTGTAADCGHRPRFAPLRSDAGRPPAGHADAVEHGRERSHVLDRDQRRGGTARGVDRRAGGDPHLEDAAERAADDRAGRSPEVGDRSAGLGEPRGGAGDRRRRHRG